jgi:S1-C subfamily serine protease
VPRVTTLDWIALAFVAFAAFLGFRKGLIASALSAIGIVVGAVVGARLAPVFLPGGDESPYTPLVGLLGAAVGALLLETAATLGGSVIRGALVVPPFRALDSLGGFVLGGAAGLAVVWVAGAAALHFPGQTELRQAAQRSTILAELNRIVPPSRLMDAIARVDPFPTIVGPRPPSEAPDPAVLNRPGVREAAPSVVRVLGTACGLAVSGSGWVASPGVVVTAAHAVAGQRDTTVQAPGGRRLRARAIAYDPTNDIAVLRAPRLRAPSLRLDDGDSGAPVAILGYPENGPLTAEPGRIGRTATVLTEDAYGRGPVRRTVTALSGEVRHGNSGGPAVNGQGEVETTVFAARIGESGGFGVPPSIVRNTLASAGGPVSTGSCVG